VCVCVWWGSQHSNEQKERGPRPRWWGRRACVRVCVCVQARGRPPRRACRVPPLRAVSVRVCVCVCVCGVGRRVRVPPVASGPLWGPGARGGVGVNRRGPFPFFSLARPPCTRLSAGASLLSLSVRPAHTRTPLHARLRLNSGPRLAPHALNPASGGRHTRAHAGEKREQGVGWGGGGRCGVDCACLFARPPCRSTSPAFPAATTPTCAQPPTLATWCARVEGARPAPRNRKFFVRRVLARRKKRAPPHLSTPCAVPPPP